MKNQNLHYLLFCCIILKMIKNKRKPMTASFYFYLTEIRIATDSPYSESTWLFLLLLSYQFPIEVSGNIHFCRQ